MNIKIRRIIGTMKFSDRYGYTTPLSVLITECLPKEVENAICSVLDDLRQILDDVSWRRVQKEYKDEGLTYSKLEQSVWRNFLHKRKGSLHIHYGKCQEVMTDYIQGQHPWYEKLNLLEYLVGELKEYSLTHEDYYEKILNIIVVRLNNSFKELYYGYHIVDYSVVPITDSIEIESIQSAIEEGKDNVRVHLEAALSHFAKRPNPDCRNSIKESISAVECVCREITGESTLDRAIPKLQAKGVQLNPQFEEGLKKMYYYTNDQRTGIRHALLDDAYVPTIVEAKYMLVICAAFVNYIRMLIV